MAIRQIKEEGFELLPSRAQQFEALDDILDNWR